MVTNNAANNKTATLGKVLQGQGIGIASDFSTATYPSIATGTGTILRADGTNWAATTATYPNTTTVSQILYSSAANTITGLATANNSALVTDATGIPSLGTSLINDFTYTSSTAGATRTLTVSNTNNSNTASIALSQITTGGASAGDPFQTFTVTGATSWSHGIDNSVSDTYVLAASTALGTTNVMSATTAGAVSFVLGNVDVTKSASGVDVSLTVSNTSNTATSTASHFAIVAGSTASDAKYNAQITGGQNWTWGLDNSDSDAFAIAASSALGTTNIMRASTTGIINYPLQPAFSVYVGNTITNVTGAGTAYTIVWDAELLDQGGNMTTTTFTAPVTGFYSFTANVFMDGITAAMTTWQLDIDVAGTSAFIYRTEINGYTLAIKRSFSNAVLAKMTAGDTCVVKINGQNGAGNTADVVAAGTQLITNFSGYLLC